VLAESVARNELGGASPPGAGCSGARRPRRRSPGVWRSTAARRLRLVVRAPCGLHTRSILGAFFVQHVALY